MSKLTLTQAREAARAAKAARQPKLLSAKEAGLSKADLAEIRSRIRDLKDPTRYIICGSRSTRSAMVYDVASDTYVSFWLKRNEALSLAHASAFKRRHLAEAFLKILKKDRSHCRDFMVVKCRLNKTGELSANSVRNGVVAAKLGTF